jgi:hypothetical protein
MPGAWSHTSIMTSVWSLNKRSWITGSRPSL